MEGDREVFKNNSINKTCIPLATSTAFILKMSSHKTPHPNWPVFVTF